MASFSNNSLNPALVRVSWKKLPLLKVGTYKFPLKNGAGGDIFNFNKVFSVFFRVLYSRN
jgi:hypothetical protein